MVECVESPRVLLVGGRSPAGERFRLALLYAGYETTAVHDYGASVEAATDLAPAVAVIDLDTPDYDGVAVCRRLRRSFDAPALLLGSQGTTTEAVAAFEAGADDYMPPPIALEELEARVKALLRRARRNSPRPTILRWADLTLDTKMRIGTRSGRDLRLTTTELDLLALFLAHPEQVLTHELLLESVWRHPATATTGNLEVCMHYLRAKMEEGGAPRLIQTIRGGGYALRTQ